MRTILLVQLLAASCLISTNTYSAQTAQADLLNSSVRLNTSACDCDIGGLVWHMDFSSTYAEERNYANHEVAPVPQPASYSHWSYMILEDPSMWTSTSYMEVNLPADDINANGTPDFFESGIPVTTSSLGVYQIEWGPCPLSIKWSRAAGAMTGSYELTMHDSMLGEIGPFRGSFDLIRCSGTLSYTPGVVEVAGWLSLPASAVTAELQGPVKVTKSSSDPLNKLTLQAGALTNEFDNLAFEAAPLTRNGSVYRGPFTLPIGAYSGWTLLITDPNDSDHDGIPDLSDTVSAPPNRPVLSLKVAPGGLQLVVSGNTGRTCYVEETPSLRQPTWEVAKSVALTSDPQVVEMPRESGGTPKFWRVRVE